MSLLIYCGGWAILHEIMVGTTDGDGEVWLVSWRAEMARLKWSRRVFKSAVQSKEEEGLGELGVGVRIRSLKRRARNPCIARNDVLGK